MGGGRARAVPSARARMPIADPWPAEAAPITEPAPEPRLARRRAAATLIATLLAVALLGLIGLGVEDHLRPTSLAIEGTPSARGEDLARQRFGDSSPFVVLLRGPAGAIERQGPRLAAILRRDPKVTVISPWDPAPRGPKAPRAAPGHAAGRPLPCAAGPRLPPSPRRGDARNGPRAGRHPRGQRPPARSKPSSPATRASRARCSPNRSRPPSAPSSSPPRFCFWSCSLVFRSVLAALIPLAFGAMTVLAGPRRPRLPHLADADRRPLAGRLHDDGARPRRRLLAADRLPLPRGARRRPLAGRRRRRDPAQRRAHHRPGRRRPSSSRSSSPPSSSPAPSSSRSPPRSPWSPRSPSSSPGPPCPPCSPCSAPASTPGRSAARGRAPARASPPPRRRPCADLPSPASRSRSPCSCSRRRRSPSTPARPGSTSSRPRATRGRDSEAISAAVGPGWQAPFILTVAAERGPITARRRLEFLTATQRRIEGRSGVESGDRPRRDRRRRRAAALARRRARARTAPPRPPS